VLRRRLNYQSTSVMDEATRRQRLRNEVKWSRQLQEVLAHAAPVLAFLHGWTKNEGCSASVHSVASGSNHGDQDPALDSYPALEGEN
jgi:hypothetical protein